MRQKEPRNGGPQLEYRLALSDTITATSKWPSTAIPMALRRANTQQVVTTTSEHLDIHPNTVRQRLDRIDRLLGVEWRRGPRSVDTHVALRCWQLSRADRL
jgi:hypothetical protein